MAENDSAVKEGENNLIAYDEIATHSPHPVRTHSALYTTDVLFYGTEIAVRNSL